MGTMILSKTESKRLADLETIIKEGTAVFLRVGRALMDIRDAELYRETYGEAESIPTLVPFMLQTFLDGDRAFQKAMRERFTMDSAAEGGSAARRQSATSS